MGETFEIRIKPQFTRDAKRFVEETRKEFATVGAGGGITKGATKGIGRAGGAVGLGVIAGFLGPQIAVLIAAVATLVDVFKPVISILKGIFRLIGEFLRPIADIMIILLAPILSILRPILIVFRAILQPFRRAAFQLLRAGQQQFAAGNEGEAFQLFGAAFATLFTGLNVVFLSLVADILGVVVDAIATGTQLLVSVVLTSLGVLVGLFSETAAQAIFDLRDNFVENIGEFAEFVKDGIDAGIGLIILGSAEGINEMATRLGVDLGTFKNDVATMVDAVIIDDENSIWNTFKNNLTGAGGLTERVIPEINSAFDSIASAIVDGILGLPGRVVGAAGGRIRSSFTSFGATTTLPLRGR